MSFSDFYVSSGFSDKITKSANLPFSSESRLLSSNTCHAASMVMARKADSPTDFLGFAQYSSAKAAFFYSTAIAKSIPKSSPV
jgi:hypothetical protein